MTSTPELNRKLNGSENPKSTSSSEEDPCIVESKAEKLSFKDRTEKKLREKSGLSRRGLVIAGVVLLVLLLLLITVIALGAAWPRSPHHRQYPICEDSACLYAAAQIRESLNTSVEPCTDIWNWACGKWLRNNPLPKDRSIWDVQQKLSYEESSRIRELIATFPSSLPTGSLKWKVKYLYESCLDMDNVVADDIRPLKLIISQLGGWHILREWNVLSWDYRRVLERLHAEYGATPFFKITVEPNPQSPDKNSIRIAPAGLGLPDRSFYYAEPDDKIVVAYKRLLKDIVSKLSATTSEANKFSNDIFYYEKRIAEITPESSLLKDPINTYNPISVSELKITAASIPLRDILVSMFPKGGITDETEILVSSHDYLTAVSGIISSTDRTALNNYVIWSLVREYLPYLPTTYTVELQQYIKELTGVDEPFDRWETCANMVQRFMGVAIQSMLEEKSTFNNTTIVKNTFNHIKNAALKHINGFHFPNEFHRHAIQKTASLSLQIGLPKNVTTNTYLKTYYSNFFVQRSSLFQNILYGVNFLRSEQEQRYLQPQSEYRLIPFATPENPQVGYSGPSNTIIIPRILLTSPYFDPSYPKAVIYGRLGVNIANAIVDSILPFEGSWTKDKGLLSPYSAVVNQSIKATTKPRYCLSKFMTNKNSIPEHIADLTSLSTLKHISAVKIADTALSLSLENEEHVHQPTLEIYEDTALFYITYSQTQCSKYTEQQELLDNYVNFRLANKIQLQMSWQQIPNFSNSFSCPKDRRTQCSDIL